MIPAIFSTLCVLLRSRSELVLEILALRQQLAILKQRRPRPRLSSTDRLFWTLLSRFWRPWRRVLLLVQPETVVRWHQAGFRLFWRWKSRQKSGGRSTVDSEIKNLIRRMARENPTWGAPRIHGELLMLGFQVAQSTVSKYLPKRPTCPDTIRRWKAFLRLHQEGIAAIDFFTVTTLTFQILHVLVVFHHHRRRILHWAVSLQPTEDWIRQQLREAFPYDTAPRYLILDRDPRFGQRFLSFLRNLGVKPVRISPRSPWQNGFCERFFGSVRREILDHVVVFNERHLHALLKDYIEVYYHLDRTHLGLKKETPKVRLPETRPAQGAKVIGFPRVGGLHHRYSWLEAA